MYPRTENDPEVHPLLRYPLSVAENAVFPEMSITHTDPDSKEKAFLKENGTNGETMVVPPMVLEALKICVRENPNMTEGSQYWLRMCLGLTHRYNSMGYVDYEPAS